MHFLTTGALAALLLTALPAAAQQEGSVGMDEIDESVSAASGDEVDARAAQDAAMARMEQSHQALSDRVDGLEQRLRLLEQQANQR